MQAAVGVSGAGRGSQCEVRVEAPYCLEESVGRRIGETSAEGKRPCLGEEVELGRILQVEHNLGMRVDSLERIAKVVDPTEEDVDLEGKSVMVVGMPVVVAQDRSVRSGS